jgi:3-dehydroquinate dehydratase type I
MSTSLLCETVAGQTLAQLIRARDAAGAADLVELRLDGVTDLDVARALAGRRGPVIVTCRPGWEGGRFSGTETERQAILERALDLGADYVDVEWKAGFKTLIASHGGRVVVSSHDFKGVPTDLATRVQAMRDTGAAVSRGYAAAD